jgi:hypothetical protein
MVRKTHSAGLLLALAAIVIGPAGAAFARSPHPSGGTHTLATPRGSAVVTGQSSGVQSALLPGGGTGIVTNNGNGFSTITGANGQVTTMPSQR